MLDYKKSYDICEFHEILLISVNRCRIVLSMLTSFWFLIWNEMMLGFYVQVCLYKKPLADPGGQVPS